MMLHRAKAYESIIKNEPIQGPNFLKVSTFSLRSFKVLGLKVDLLDNGDKRLQIT